MKRWITIISALLMLAVTPVYAAPPAQEDNWTCAQVNGQLSLNIRAEPSSTAPLVSTLAPGDQLEADYERVTTGSDYNWVPVRFLGGAGWTITARLSPCDDAPTSADDPGEHVLQGVNRDGILDRDEIEQIARSVVLIASVRRDRIVATGTGTVTTPDGLIVTNAHVVAGAEQVAIGLLRDINETPEYLYMGDVISIDEQIDVALILIRADIRGRPVNVATLNLPYIPATLHPNDVFRGDAIYIFGYPGIGDDFLVVTTGSIVSVENGDVAGQRLPVWYRTDAEIAPGNSGGLAVNSNGEFVGIPTFVQTEAETGGRLGGIRPAEVALMAVLDRADTVLANPPPAASAEPDLTVELPVDLAAAGVMVQHGVEMEGQAGIAFLVAFSINGWAQQDAMVFARFYHDDLAAAPVINPDSPARYHDKDNAVLTSTAIIPCCDQTAYEDLSLFLPYAALGFTDAGVYPLKVRIEIVGAGEAWRRTLSWEFVTYTRG